MINPDNIYKINIIKDAEDELEKILEEFKDINFKMKRKNKTRKKRKIKHDKHDNKKGGGKLNITRKQILNKF
jgi:hypothetical protein